MEESKKLGEVLKEKELEKIVGGDSHSSRYSCWKCGCEFTNYEAKSAHERTCNGK